MYVCKYLKVMIVRWEYGDSVLIMTVVIWFSIMVVVVHMVKVMMLNLIISLCSGSLNSSVGGIDDDQTLHVECNYAALSWLRDLERVKLFQFRSKVRVKDKVVPI